MKNVKIHNELLANEPFILITYTTGFGLVPKSVSDFLKVNHECMCGVASSGNMNWGLNFAKAADILSQQYNVPIIHKFELSGNENDIKIFKERLIQISGR